jgi:hypothetical protein
MEDSIRFSRVANLLKELDAVTAGGPAKAKATTAHQTASLLNSGMRIGSHGGQN